jgi:hypothetical protein
MVQNYCIRNPDVETYRLVYIWVESGRGGVGWSPDELLLLGGVSSFFLGHFHGNLSISPEFSGQAQSIANLFEQIG